MVTEKSRQQLLSMKYWLQGMLQLAGWDGKGNFLDPMCGSGTLLIEAGMVAMDLPAQIFRKEFGFMNWKNYDAELFEKIKEFRVNRVKAFEGKIVGYDINEDALDVAWKNIKEAEMDDIITVKRKTSLIQKRICSHC